MKWILLLFLALAGCRAPIMETPSEYQTVLVAVGANGSIARCVVTWGEVMARPTKQITQSGDVTITGNLTVVGNFSQNQQQSGQVNMGLGAAGYSGDLYVRGHLYQALGESWSGLIANNFAGANIYGIGFGNGVFVAVGAGPKLSRSTDYGATWSALINSHLGGASGYCACYGGGIFLVGGDSNGVSGQISRSTDNGLTWAAIANPFAGAGAQINKIAFGNGVFVAVGGFPGTAQLAYSKDLGLTWTLSTSSFTTQVSSIAFGNGVFVVAGGNNQVAFSVNNGVSFGALVTVPFGGTSPRSVAFGNGFFVMANDNGEIIRSKDNGVSWGSLIINPFSAGNILYGMTFNFGIFQATSNVGTTARSYDNGATWGGLATNPFGANIIYDIASSPQTTPGAGNMCAVGAAGSIATAGWNDVPMYHEAPYTPTFTGFGVPSNVAFTWCRVGNRLKVMGLFTSGIPTAVIGKLSLPGSLLSDSALITSTRLCGYMATDASGASSFTCLIESGVGFITFGVQNATNGGLTEILANSFAANGRSFSVQFEFPISGWNV